MSEVIFSFGMKTEEVQSIFGCKNIAVEKKIKKTNSFKAYKDFLPQGFVKTPAEALKEMMQGSECDVNSYYAYGYALICICEAFGDVMPYEYEFQERDIQLGEQTNLINQILCDEFNMIEFEFEKIVLKENSHPFKIPVRDSKPLIGLIKNNEIPALLAKLSHIDITDEQIEQLLESENEAGEKKGMAYQHIQAFINNLNDCIEFEYDYISFSH